MQRYSLFSRAICLAVAVCAFAYGAAVAVATKYVIKPAREAAAGIGSGLKALVLHGLKLAVPDAGGKVASVVAFLQAKAFQLRLAKRHRPLVTDTWRMCPSI